MIIKFNKKDLGLIISGFLILIFLLGILVFTIGFMVKVSNQILGSDRSLPAAVERFNLEGLKEINDKLPPDLRI